MPGWHSRHTGWGHTGREDPEVQAGLQSQGFLVLPGLQLVLGSHLYHNQEYQMDLRIMPEGHLGVTESYSLSSATTTVMSNPPLHP